MSKVKLQLNIVNNVQKSMNIVTLLKKKKKIQEKPSQKFL